MQRHNPKQPVPKFFFDLKENGDRQHKSPAHNASPLRSPEAHSSLPRRSTKSGILHPHLPPVSNATTTNRHRSPDNNSKFFRSLSWRALLQIALPLPFWCALCHSRSKRFANHRGNPIQSRQTHVSARHVGRRGRHVPCRPRNTLGAEYPAQEQPKVLSSRRPRTGDFRGWSAGTYQGCSGENPWPSSNLLALVSTNPTQA